MLGEDGSRKVSKPFLNSEIVNQPQHAHGQNGNPKSVLQDHLINTTGL